MKLNQSCVNETISSMLSDKISALFFTEDLYVTFKWCGPLRLIQFILYTA